MRKFLKEFKNDYAEENINYPLMHRQLEPPLFEYILDVFRSFENTGFIFLKEYEYIEDESKIPIEEFVISRRRKRKKSDESKIVNIDYDRVALLRMKFIVRVKENEVEKTVELLLPKFDSGNFLCIKGKSIYLLYQMVNGSTYVTKNSVTLKGLMPLCITRRSVQYTDTRDCTHTLPIYYILNFSKAFNPISLFSAKFGFYEALEMFECFNIIKVVSLTDKEKNGWLYFNIMNEVASSKKKKTEETTETVKPTKIKICVIEELFNKYTFVKAVTAMVIHALSSYKKPTKESIIEKGGWLEVLGALYVTGKFTNKDIGKSTLVFYERLIDNINKRILRMYDYNKKDVYSITSTIIQNFDEFKKKDNNDINSRRLRLNECIAALTSIRMGKSISRILAKGDKATIEDVVGILKIPANLIFKLLYTSPIITYNDIVNDMNFFNAFKFTIRGPNSIGAGNERKITAKDRGVSITAIGKLDADVCSSSSPGLGGLVSPFVKTYGLYFIPEDEPQDSIWKMLKESEKYIPEDSIHFRLPDTYEEFIKMKMDWVEKLNTMIKLLKDNDVIVVEE